jgi:MEMO1 family protein
MHLSKDAASKNENDYTAMRDYYILLLPVLLFTIQCGCRHKAETAAVRQPVDTIGFAQYSWQIDSIIDRTNRQQPEQLRNANSVFAEDSTTLRLAVSPHDDYSYVGYLYPSLLKHVRSKVVIMFGVAHKAKSFGLQNRLVFGSTRTWKSPKGEIKISSLQEKIMRELPRGYFIVNDSMQNAEHSLEALTPFLEYYNPAVEIIPVLVPFMSLERIDSIALPLASAIHRVMNNAGLEWGKGYSILISSDAVHYGNEEWGGKDYARFGVDSVGYQEAVNYEKQIIKDCFEGIVTSERIKLFYNYTVSSDDYHEYKWTWCGRYSIPLGMETAIALSGLTGQPLYGKTIGYSNSIANKPVYVEDLRMGQTAPARLAHWVGYAAVGFE